MNKKAQSLSLNTIIIAILVVLVLIVVVTFFLGGFGRIKDTIVNVFYPVTGGTDLAIAVQTCEQYCDQARLLPSNTIRRQSSYCKSSFNIDYDPRDGEVDKESDGKLKRYYCYETLQVPCQLDDGKQLKGICLNLDADLGTDETETQ